jgi:hypothetical protein
MEFEERFGGIGGDGMPQEDAAPPVHTSRGMVMADRQPGDQPWRGFVETAYQREGPHSRWWLRPGLPRQLGTLVRNELGDQAVTFFVSQSVGNIELLHQPQEIGVIARRIGWPVGPFLPDLPEPYVVEHAPSLSRFLVLEHITDCLGEPLRIQDHNVLKPLILPVVDDVTQIVHQLG